ncbi:2-C-methyl-D-erythritol 2,4-cyclodiphosphate synthase [Hoeflea marina]|uniref:Bifunctional enzyme IspD/IspF n=1 Tax=Hoeflea marina TaxID=274592 RepID=A0A317PUH3_9HYPH|nr:bifunctional 2-C-methyl-D-erythritol 4-phosphate cytidylyltransferase/2-C-methyl-D-erythritol 2,4-cyclodiphosphate synthase [Hoeflea marina]PWW03896.1 2-C-methyl-D-erythritol 2,4-cyclodiphosphate synthase [Hoeflea marina]
MATEADFAVVMVAAGRGERAGSATTSGPKQYRTIGGVPVIARTLARFLAHRGCRMLVAVIHPDDEALFAEALGHVGSASRVVTVHGGATRQQSCLAGLAALSEHGPRWVLIQDAVRPFVDHAVIDGVLGALQAGAEAALPAVPVADTLKRAGADNQVTETVARAGLYGAQTPQGFEFRRILAAHRAAAAAGVGDFTDDCAIAEWAGMAVTLTPGTTANVKLTTAEDIAMADRKFSASALPDVRTGNGYDVHRLVPGDQVTLCGVRIPHHLTLDGHSDADVALHALTDALLATCGAGDIGDHFPPSDPQWRGAASSIFLAHAARIVREAGGTIMNADVSLIAEAPKIGPHRLDMRRQLSEILGLDLERCSVKATTNERIGFVGRNEGIAAIATATVVFAPKTS